MLTKNSGADPTTSSPPAYTLAYEPDLAEGTVQWISGKLSKVPATGGPVVVEHPPVCGVGSPVR